MVKSKPTKPKASKENASKLKNKKQEILEDVEWEITAIQSHYPRNATSGTPCHYKVNFVKKGNLTWPEYENWVVWKNMRCAEMVQKYWNKIKKDNSHLKYKVPVQITALYNDIPSSTANNVNSSANTLADNKKPSEPKSTKGKPTNRGRSKKQGESSSTANNLQAPANQRKANKDSQEQSKTKTTEGKQTNRGRSKKQGESNESSSTANSLQVSANKRKTNKDSQEQSKTKTTEGKQTNRGRSTKQGESDELSSTANNLPNLVEALVESEKMDEGIQEQPFEPTSNRNTQTKRGRSQKQDKVESQEIQLISTTSRSNKSISKKLPAEKIVISDRESKVEDGIPESNSTNETLKTKKQTKRGHSNKQEVESQVKRIKLITSNTSTSDELLDPVNNAVAADRESKVEDSISESNSTNDVQKKKKQPKKSRPKEQRETKDREEESQTSGSNNSNTGSDEAQNVDNKTARRSKRQKPPLLEFTELKEKRISKPRFLLPPSENVRSSNDVRPEKASMLTPLKNSELLKGIHSEASRFRYYAEERNLDYESDKESSEDLHKQYLEQRDSAIKNNLCIVNDLITIDDEEEDVLSDPSIDTPRKRMSIYYKSDFKMERGSSRSQLKVVPIKIEPPDSSGYSHDS